MTDSGSRGAKLSEILADLKAEYQKKFPAKIQTVRAVFDRRDWSHLAEEFHKLKGTGKTYGFPEVSLLCESLEEYCRTVSVDPSLIEKVFLVFARMQESWRQGRNFDLNLDVEAQALLKGLVDAKRSQ